MIFCIGLAHRLADDGDDIDSLFENDFSNTESEHDDHIREEVKAVKEPKKVSKEQSLLYDPVPVFKSPTEKYLYYLMKYKIEFVLSLLVILFLSKFFTGKNQNYALALTFHNKVYHIINKFFGPNHSF